MVMSFFNEFHNFYYVSKVGCLRHSWGEEGMHQPKSGFFWTAIKTQFRAMTNYERKNLMTTIETKETPVRKAKNYPWKLFPENFSLT